MHNGYFRKLKYTFFGKHNCIPPNCTIIWPKENGAIRLKTSGQLQFRLYFNKVSVYGKESFRKIFNPAADKNSFFCNCFPKSPKERTDPDNDMTTKQILYVE